MGFSFTTSWDDGHPLDLRIAELLARHGFAGTFYVPCRNSERRPVLSTAELRELSARFEVGSHTADHTRLDVISSEAARAQIVAGKRGLEDQLGQRVDGFCYPFGGYSDAVRAEVVAAGFRYARTTSSLWLDAPHDTFRIPTTIQLYPHRRRTYAKNFASGRSWLARASAFSIAFRRRTLDSLLIELLERARAGAGMFHLWGHSWEIDEQGLWGALERFLARAADLVPAAARVDNRGLATVLEQTT